MSSATRLRPQFTDHCFTGDYPTHLLTDRAVGGRACRSEQLSLLAEVG